MRLLTVCSTRKRAVRCEEMLTSFFATRSEGTEIFLYVDELDPQVEQYKALFAKFPVQFEIGPHKYQPEVFNYASCVKFPGMEYYSEVNDDHLFRTPEWDKKMIAVLQNHGGWGMVYGHTQHLPTATMISGNVVRALGYWVVPGFYHLYVDNYFQDLFGETGLLFHAPEVLIEHMHPGFGKAQQDETYQWVYAPEQYAHDGEVYCKWRDTQKQDDIARLKAAIKMDNR